MLAGLGLGVATVVESGFLGGLGGLGRGFCCGRFFWVGGWVGAASCWRFEVWAVGGLEGGFEVFQARWVG